MEMYWDIYSNFQHTWIHGATHKTHKKRNTETTFKQLLHVSSNMISITSSYHIYKLNHLDSNENCNNRGIIITIFIANIKKLSNLKT